MNYNVPDYYTFLPPTPVQPQFVPMNEYLKLENDVEILKGQMRGVMDELREMKEMKERRHSRK